MIFKFFVVQYCRSQIEDDGTRLLTDFGCR